jgi:branched-chain amino acid transport system permease protein
MVLPPGPVKKYIGMLVIAIWAGLLAFPFAGIAKAVQVAIATAAVMVVWRLSRTETAAALAGTVARVVASRSSVTSKLATYSTSPPALIGIAFLTLILPLFLNNYYLDILTLTGIYIVLALGLNLIVGQTGLLNLGYVAFYAIGAYTYAILSTTFGLSFWPGLLVGAMATAGFAVLLGMPILRLRGDYFAIVTLGLGEITRIVLNNWNNMTGGPNGISNIGRPVIAGYTLHETRDFYYLILVIVAITVFAMYRLISSRIGRAWLAIREDEIAAEAMGINTYKLKLLVFVLGSAWAGLAGVFFSAKMAFVSPESFTFIESVMILCMVVLGGMGSIPGVVLGAILLTIIPEVFRDFQDYRMLAFGAALVAMMVFRPQGLLGMAQGKCKVHSSKCKV